MASKFETVVVPQDTPYGIPHATSKYWGSRSDASRDEEMTRRIREGMNKEGWRKATGFVDPSAVVSEPPAGRASITLSPEAMKALQATADNYQKKGLNFGTLGERYGMGVTAQEKFKVAPTKAGSEGFYIESMRPGDTRAGFVERRKEMEPPVGSSAAPQTPAQVTEAVSRQGIERDLDALRMAGRVASEQRLLEKNMDQPNYFEDRNAFTPSISVGNPEIPTRVGPHPDSFRKLSDTKPLSAAFYKRIKPKPAGRSTELYKANVLLEATTPARHPEVKGRSSNLAEAYRIMAEQEALKKAKQKQLAKK
jgi:hypothetical protein